MEIQDEIEWFEDLRDAVANDKKADALAAIDAAIKLKRREVQAAENKPAGQKPSALTDKRYGR